MSADRYGDLAVGCKHELALLLCNGRMRRWLNRRQIAELERQLSVHVWAQTRMAELDEMQR